MDMDSKKLKKYKVWCYETVHASICIEAKSEDDALEKAYTILDEQGMPSDAKTFDRSFDSCNAELIEE